MGYGQDEPYEEYDDNECVDCGTPTGNVCKKCNVLLCDDCSILKPIGRSKLIKICGDCAGY